MLNGELDRQRIIDTIDQAIDEGWIKVHYQPIVRTASGKVSNTEALARWNDPVRGLLSPAAFIGVLEEAGLIHKLDLYMVRQVLRDLKVNEERGVRSVPVSVNISRADFDACDMVAEICEMVDAAGIERDRICLEITESVVGGDFDYMKGQIERFRGLGFQVWMDDFGSGYSSLDLLQSITVDLIKFNMGFMRQFGTSEKSHIVLRELMRMAIGIGVDTIVEGVETPQQVRFLREIGCSKMQGFYFSRPHPAETFFELYELGEALPAEDPDEADYFATIGKVNLNDPTGLVDGHGADGLFFSLNVLPMAIVEYRDGIFIVLRCNGSYKEFLRRVYGMDLAGQSREDLAQARQPGEGFCRVARRAIASGEWERVDDDFDGRLAIQSFVRRVSQNPKTGAVALVVPVLSVQDADGVVA